MDRSFFVGCQFPSCSWPFSVLCCVFDEDEGAAIDSNITAYSYDDVIPLSERFENKTGCGRAKKKRDIFGTMTRVTE